jgi:hypothetical protein
MATKYIRCVALLIAKLVYEALKATLFIFSIILHVRGTKVVYRRCVAGGNGDQVVIMIMKLW